MLSRTLIIVPLAACFVGLSAAARFVLPAPVVEQVAAIEQDAEAQTAFSVDAVHSTLLFRIRHSGVSYFHGRINKPTGSFVISDGDLENSFINVSVETANVDTANKGRDQFLAGETMFNAKAFPTAEFKSDSIRTLADGAYEATGTFTMRGVTLPVVVRVDEYIAVQTERFGHRAGFECIFTIKRSEYGMDLFVKEKTLGDEVRITVAIEGVQR